ncbi:hypothetical protein IWQ61_009550 [Dispira simplex]|nr:hypothetical protein IWQ61_009550 [Dispira simplex]
MRPNGPPGNEGDGDPLVPTLFRMVEQLFNSLGVQTPSQTVTWPSKWSDPNYTHSYNRNVPDPFDVWCRSFFSSPGDNSPRFGTDSPTDIPFDQAPQNTAQPFSNVYGGLPWSGQGEDSFQGTKALRNIILKPNSTSSTSLPKTESKSHQSYPTSTPTGPDSYFQLFNHDLDQWSTLLQQLLTPGNQFAGQSEGFSGRFNSVRTTVVQNENGTIDRTTKVTDETGQETITTTRLDAHGRVLDSTQEPNLPLLPASPVVTPIDHNAIVRSQSGRNSDPMSHSFFRPVAPQDAFGNPFGFTMDSLFSTLFDNRHIHSTFPKDSLDPIVPVPPDATPASPYMGSTGNANQAKGFPSSTYAPQMQYSYVSVRTIYNPDGSVEHRQTTRRPDGTQEVFTSREDLPVHTNSVTSGSKPTSQSPVDVSPRGTDDGSMASPGGWLDQLKHFFQS